MKPNKVVKQMALSMLGSILVREIMESIQYCGSVTVCTTDPINGGQRI
jgi:hypothetical protein